MAKLTTNQRKHLSSSEFALPGRRMFPINDEVHRQKALQLAPRALHAGTISQSELEQIRRKAKRKTVGQMVGEG